MEKKKREELWERGRILLTTDIIKDLPTHSSSHFGLSKNLVSRSDLNTDREDFNYDSQQVEIPIKISVAECKARFEKISSNRGRKLGEDTDNKSCQNNEQIMSSKQPSISDQKANHGGKFGEDSDRKGYNHVAQSANYLNNQSNLNTDQYNNGPIGSNHVTQSANPLFDRFRSRGPLDRSNLNIDLNTNGPSDSGHVDKYANLLTKASANRSNLNTDREDFNYASQQVEIPIKMVTTTKHPPKHSSQLRSELVDYLKKNYVVQSEEGKVFIQKTARDQKPVSDFVYQFNSCLLMFCFG